ncbi:hypothetical protein ACFVZR_25640 [Streptomyces sp. NPDC058316]|uniref:hypothetical protein n=1 Tax=unclassified Streptomyces TaxID=2593676 RepID=UPI0033266A05
MLPLEAIELDAFRHRHEGDTFWCGLLLGGCGGRLTTKLCTGSATSLTTETRTGRRTSAEAAPGAWPPPTTCT